MQRMCVQRAIAIEGKRTPSPAIATHPSPLQIATQLLHPIATPKSTALATLQLYIAGFVSLSEASHA